MNRRTVGASVLALLLATVTLAPSVLAQDAEDTFGTIVSVGDGDFAPILDEALHIDYVEDDVDDTSSSNGIGIVRFDAGGDGTNDAFAIDVDASNDFSADDIIIAASGFSNADPGDRVRSSHTFFGEGSAEPAHTVYADVDGDGRYSEGDYVFFTSDTAVGEDDLSKVGLSSTSTSSSSFTIRMTDTDFADAGTAAKSGDDDFDEWRNSISLDADGDDASDEFTFGYFAFYDSEGDDEFNGDQDLAYLLLIDHVDGGGTDGAPDSSDTDGSRDIGPVTMFAVRLWGVAGAFGSQVLPTDSDFVPEITYEDTIDDIGVVHYDGGTNSSSDDDIVALNLDGTDDLDASDLILGAGPDAGADAGARISGTSGLSGNGGASQTAYVAYADVDGSGHWNAGDYLYLTSTSTSGSLTATTNSGSSFTVRLTETDGGAAGTFVFSGDADLSEWDGDVSRDLSWGSDAASFAFYDHDGDGSFDGGMEMAYIIPDDTLLSTDVPHLYSVRLWGVLGDFGTTVGPEDPDGLPVLTTLDEVDTVKVIRYDEGTSEVDDDVFVIDSDSDDTISAGDCIVYSGGTDGTQAGQYVDTTHTGIIDNGDTEDALLAYGDVDSDSRFSQGDWVYLIRDDSDDEISGTTATDWSIRLSPVSAPSHAGGSWSYDTGTLVKSSDDDRVGWGSSTGTDFGIGDPTYRYYDVDDDGSLADDQDLLYAETRDDDDEGFAVSLGAVRLCGPHGFEYDGPDITEPTDDEDGDDGDDGNATDGDDGNATDGEDGTDGSVDPTTPPGPGGEDIGDGADGDDGNETGDDEDTPGVALPLLALAMLGAALAVRRRRT